VTSVETTEEAPKIKGLTDARFDGVSLPTLRAWKRYWTNPKRVKADDPELKGDLDTPAKHTAVIDAEITAREAARKA
jgi:hypothetical protein